MNLQESTDALWKKVLTTAQLPTSALSIKNSDLTEVFKKIDPWKSSENQVYIDQANRDKDHLLTKAEFSDFSNYNHIKLGFYGEKFMCNMKWDSYF